MFRPANDARFPIKANKKNTTWSLFNIAEYYFSSINGMKLYFFSLRNDLETLTEPGGRPSFELSSIVHHQQAFSTG